MMPCLVNHNSAPYFRRLIVITFVLQVVCVSVLPGAQVRPATVVSIVQRHCVKCHGKDDNVEGDIDMSGLTVKSIANDAELIRKLIEVLDSGEMPPEGEVQPAPELRRELIDGRGFVLLRGIPVQAYEVDGYVGTPATKIAGAPASTP